MPSERATSERLPRLRPALDATLRGRGRKGAVRAGASLAVRGSLDAMVRSSAQASVPFDPTVYPVEDDVGEEILQRWITETLRPLLARFLAKRGRPVFVGADQFIYWEQFNPQKAVSPDVYVLPGVSPRTPVTCWRVWETGIVPSFAVEVVARDARKDYAAAPLRYAELGVRELVVFDPHWRESARRVCWQVYRRTRRGDFLQVASTNDDRVRSAVLRCWLRRTGEGVDTRLRLATGRRGIELVRTPEEELEHLRATLARAPRAR